MKTHELRLKRAIVQARVDATRKFPVVKDEPDTERDAYCRPEYCPPTLRSPVWAPVRSHLTGNPINVCWECPTERA